MYGNTTLNFSSRRNLGKLSANLQTIQLCYLQIPNCNVEHFVVQKEVKPLTYLRSCYMFKVAKEKYFCATATKKLMPYKLGNFILNLQIKKQNLFLFLLTESLYFVIPSVTVGTTRTALIQAYQPRHIHEVPTQRGKSVTSYDLF
jgi:hypothetical protein